MKSSDGNDHISNYKCHDGIIDIDISSLANLLWSKRRYFAIIVTVSVVVGVVVSLLLNSKYTAVATILPPQTSELKISSALSGFSGIAGDLLSGAGDNTTEVYPVISRSRYVLGRVLDAPYNDATFKEEMLKRYGLQKNQTEELIGLFQEKILKTSITENNRVVNIQVTYFNPVFAAALANEILVQMENYFTYQFKSVATSKRLMIEQRLEEVSNLLRIAEDNLLEFREKNRSIDLSPKLTIQELRYVRVVEMHNTVFLELSRQLELAKISEIQLKPILNVLDKAIPPLKKSWPPRKLVVLGFIMAGFGLTVVYIIVEPFKKDVMAILSRRTQKEKNQYFS